MNPSQEAIAQLMRQGTTKKFPGNKIVDDLQANPSLWTSFYATLHNCAIPLETSSYDPEQYNLAAEHLRQLNVGKLIYNKLIIYCPGKNNRLIELAQNWGCKRHHYQFGLIRDEKQYNIQILILHFY